MKKVLLGSVILVACSGCFGNGKVVLAGDAAGVRALMDGMNGMITNGKASDDIKSAHWIAREAEETQITQRETAPGFLAQVFSMPKLSK